MPLYTYECDKCGEFELLLPIKKMKQHAMCPKCKFQAKRIINTVAIHCDSMNDVKWLPKAVENLQPDGAMKIETRGEYKAYLKKKGIQERS